MGFTIPTSFTASDSFSGVVRGMMGATESFAIKAEAQISRAERAFRKLTPVLTHAQHELFEMASAAEIAMKGIELGEFSFESLTKYQDKLANLQATTGLTGKAFDGFKDKILEVANTSKKSALDVADVFTIVAKANPDLADNADGLSKVADAAILMAKATGSQLAPAAESLTTLMNKMGLQAEDSAEMVDVLAAASQAGKYKINDLSDGLTQFGMTAKAMGMSIAEDTALLQLSSTFRAAGEGATESGAHIRKFLIVLENMKTVTPQTKASLEHMGVHTKVLASSTVSLADKLEMLQKIQGKGALIDKLFGPRNAEYVKGLLSHADALDGLMEKTKEQGKAEEMAAVRESTLEESLNRLKSAWTNMLIGSDAARDGMTFFQRSIEFLTDHLAAIVEIGGSALVLFLGLKAAFMVGRAYLFAYNIALGLYNALTKKSVVYTEAQAVALEAQKVATKLATVATEELNIAMLASPIGVALGLLGLLGIGYELLHNDADDAAKSIDELNKKMEKNILLNAEKVYNDNQAEIKHDKMVAKIPILKGSDFGISGADTLTSGKRRGDYNGPDFSPFVIPEASSKDVQHEAIMSKMEQTNHAKATITIKDPNNRTETTGGGPGIEIKTVSTHPAH
jgi:TP901 family phage tail tape measure protein